MNQPLDSSEVLGLQQALQSSRGALELVAHKKGAQAWLSREAQTESGTEELCGLLEHRIAAPSFAEELEVQRKQQLQPPQQQQQGGLPLSPSTEVLQRDWWELQPDGGMTTVVAEATGDYIVVEREDVVDALSQFIAAYISSLPDARALEPRELQRAITITLKELRKGRVRRMVDWGRLVYRVGAAGYGAFSVAGWCFSNPWIAKALVTAMWTFVRTVGRLAF